jgi:dTDP-4-amino-4,6-dideoxygalactose transaminase
MAATAVFPATSDTPFLPFHRALIESEEIEAVLETLRSGWLTTGPRVKQFEAAFGTAVGAPHAVAVSSCTAALHLSLEAIGLREGDEVLLPTMTFAATGTVVLYFRARPVLIDSAPDSFHMDPKLVERHIGPRTKAIIPVHYSGFASGLDQIVNIAERRNLRIIEDAAHAFPSTYLGRPIGAIGDLTCFSFYSTKTITTGEGGMVTTKDAELAARIRMLSLHGMNRDAWKRYTSVGSWRYDIEAAGYKYNLTDLQAALGLAQLQKYRRLRDLRALLAERYTTALTSLEAYSTPRVPPKVEHAWHLYVIQVNAQVLSISRDQVIEELKRRGIGASVHFIPLHLHPLYQRLGYRPGDFPCAEAAFAGAISLPFFPGMTFEEQDRVIEALEDIARAHRR